jgi:hypothetical protein
MPSTYEPIATTTIGTATNSVTFSSIPSTYTDLVLVFDGKMVTAEVLLVQVNSDTGSNYSLTRINGNGTTAVSDRASGITYMSFSWAGTGKTDQFTEIINFMNYSNTTTFKTVIGRTSNATYEVTQGVNLWRSTSAINAVKIYGNASGNIAVGSVVTLYGIKAA